MIKPENVPKEAIAELRAFLNSCDCDDCVSVAIAAALNAWPGLQTGSDDGGMTLSGVYLPLAQTQEGGDVGL